MVLVGAARPAIAGDKQERCSESRQACQRAPQEAGTIEIFFNAGRDSSTVVGSRDHEWSFEVKKENFS